MIDLDRMRLLDPEAVRDYLGDGNFGGYYQRPDAEMQAIWEVAVAETRALIEGPWAVSARVLVWGAGAIGGTLGAALPAGGPRGRCSWIAPPITSRRSPRGASRIRGRSRGTRCGRRAITPAERRGHVRAASSSA